MNSQYENGAFVLRISLGVAIIAHSLYLKMMVFTLAGTAQFFGSLGLPEFMAYVVFIIESITGIALLVGIYSRYAAAVLIPVLLGATWVHFPSGWLFSNANGGWEYPLFLSLAALAQTFLGDGAYALKSLIHGNVNTQPKMS